jgi:hypothetical protein
MHLRRFAGVSSGLLSRPYRLAPTLRSMSCVGGNRGTILWPQYYKATRKGAYSFVTRSFSSQAEWMPSSTSALLARIQQPDIAPRVAIVNADSSHTTYADLYERSVKLSELLKPYLKSGSTLASYCSGSEDYVVAMMAAWQMHW